MAGMKLMILLIVHRSTCIYIYMNYKLCFFRDASSQILPYLLRTLEKTLNYDLEIEVYRNCTLCINKCVSVKILIIIGFCILIVSFIKKKKIKKQLFACSLNLMSLMKFQRNFTIISEEVDFIFW